MKLVILAILTLSIMAWEPTNWEYELDQPTDFKNASHNATLFIQGFVYGAYQVPIYDMANCTSYSVDFIKTLERDFRPIANGTIF